MTRLVAGNAMKKSMTNGKIPIMQDPSQGYSWSGISRKVIYQ